MTTRTQADTYHDGKRERCTRCRKVVYPTQEEAEDVVRALESRQGPLRAYFKQRCGWWHLTKDWSRRGRGQELARRPKKESTHWDNRWAHLLADPRATGVIIPATGRGYRRTSNPPPRPFPVQG